MTTQDPEMLEWSSGMMDVHLEPTITTAGTETVYTGTQNTSQGHSNNLGPIHESISDMVTIMQKVYTTTTKDQEFKNLGWRRFDNWKNSGCFCVWQA